MSVIEVFLRRPEALEVPSVDWEEGAGLRTQGSRLPFEMLRHSRLTVHQPPVSSRYPALELGYRARQAWLVRIACRGGMGATSDGFEWL